MVTAKRDVRNTRFTIMNGERSVIEPQGDALTPILGHKENSRPHGSQTSAPRRLGTKAHFKQFLHPCGQLIVLGTRSEVDIHVHARDYASKRSGEATRRG